MTLDELQRSMHGVLRGTTSVIEGAEQLGVDPERLTIYRDFVAGHVRSSISHYLTDTKRALGPDRWAVLSQRYFDECPPSHWEFSRTAEPFVAFLARSSEDASLGVEPHHVALARLEWEEWLAYIHPEVTPKPETLSAPTLNPTVSLLESAVPIVRWTVALRDLPDDASVPDYPLPSAATATRASGPELIILFRSPTTMRATFWMATDDLLFALKVAHGGLDPEEAARDAGLPVDAARAAFDRAAEIGLVLTPR